MYFKYSIVKTTLDFGASLVGSCSGFLVAVSYWINIIIITVLYAIKLNKFENIGFTSVLLGLRQGYSDSFGLFVNKLSLGFSGSLASFLSCYKNNIIT